MLKLYVEFYPRAFKLLPYRFFRNFKIINVKNTDGDASYFRKDIHMPIKCHTAVGTKIVCQISVFLRCSSIAGYFAKNFYLLMKKINIVRII